METEQRAGVRKSAIYLLLAAVCAAALLGCLLAYQYDNKYTAPGPQGARGVLLLDEPSLVEHPVIMLVEGWEYYGGRLLTPKDFADGTLLPDKYIYIGGYGGFEAGNPNASPHGSATYRMVIDLPNKPHAYTLELPEIFSAYRAYINGRLATSMGDPDPESYRPETLNRTVSFEAGGPVEIIIAVSDFSHLYSGMVYPPAFGLQDAVSQLLSARFLFRASLCIAALTIGTLSILVGVLSRRSKSAVLYGLLCLFFVCYIAYPIVKSFVREYYPFYALENFSYCAMLVVVMLLQRRICEIKSRWSLAFPLFGVFTCAASIILHLLLSGGSLRVMYAYSWLITAYEWITAGYLTAAAVRAAWKDLIHSTPLLIGVVTLDVALVMDRLLPLYEPIITGWFPELASFVLVLSIGTVIGKEVAEQYAENAALSERANSMDRLLRMQQSYYTVLEAKMGEAKTIRHDLRHHFRIISGFIQNKQYKELETYVAEYGRDIATAEPVAYCGNRVINVLANHFGQIAKKNGIQFDLRCDMSGEINIADADLCGLLSNLLENAIEACQRVESGKRFIRTGIVQMGSMLTIRVWNSTDDSLQRTADGFASTKGAEGTGYGLYSIKTIAKKYGGHAAIDWDRESRVFDHSVSLMVSEAVRP